MNNNEPIPNNLVSRLKHKPYITEPDLLPNNVKFMLFGIPISNIFGNCMQISTFSSDNGLEHRIHRCGENSVHEIFDKKTLDFKGVEEELDLRLNGQIEWGKPARSSGWFSNGLLGRRYGRDWQSDSNKPDLVVSNSTERNLLMGVSESSVLIVSSSFSRSQICQFVKRTMICRYMDKYRGKVTNDAYNQGHKDGYDLSKTIHYSEGYLEGKADSTAFIANSNSDKSCQSMVNEMRKMMDRNCEDRLKSQRKTLERKIDGEFARGFGNGINTQLPNPEKSKKAKESKN